MLGYREYAIIPLIILLAVSLLVQRPYLFAIFVILLAGIMSYDVLGMCVKRFKSRPPPVSRVIIRDLHPDRLVSLFKPVLKISVIQKVQDSIEERIKSYILRSGTTENPRVLGIKSVVYSMISVVIIVPAGILVFYLSYMAAIAIVCVPVFVFGFYFMTLKIKESGRKSAIEQELAPFAILASIMESVNVPLFSTLDMMAGSPANILRVMKKEGLRIRNITSLGMSPTDALMDLADSHPSIMFRDFLEGYVSSFNTGGTDTSKYLQEQAHRFFRFVQSNMVRYTQQAEIIAQVILTIMLLLPMMGLSMMFFATGPLASVVILLLIIILPFIAVILILVIEVKQPKNPENTHVSWLILPAGVLGAAAVYFITFQTWQSIGTGVVIASFLNMVLIRQRFANVSQIEASLPEFMRQMTRYKNIGIDIMGAIKHARYDIVQRRKLAKSSRFNHTFDDLIDSIYRRVSVGDSLEQAVSRIQIHSWNARLIFFILGKVHESGGGTAKTLDEITHWITEYADSKKEMIANLRASLMTAFIGPVLMVMMSVFSSHISDTFEDRYDGTRFDGMVNIAPAADVAGLSEVLTVVAVVCMGVVLSKINYFTIKHTMFTGIITVFTMVLLYVAPYLVEFVLD